MARTLLQVLGEMGHEVVTKGREARMLCPYHDDHDPSMSITPEAGHHGLGLFRCFVCDAAGDAVNLLEDIHGMATAEAMEYVFGKKEKPRADPAAQRRAREDNIFYFAELPEHKDRYDYRDAEGNGLFVVLRRLMRRQRKDKDTGEVSYRTVKTFTQMYPIKMPMDWWRPRKQGKKWVTDKSGPPTIEKGQTAWKGALPEMDAYPLYQLKELLEGDPQRDVVLVEGEKCVHALKKAFPHAVVTTWHGGAKKLADKNGKWWTDFSPLYKRKVLLMPDGDPPGRAAMQKIAELLHSHGNRRIRIVPNGGSDGHDIADVLEEKGAKGAAKWVEASVVDWKPPSTTGTPSPDKPTEDGAQPPPRDICENEYYKVLGLQGTNVQFMLRTNHLYPIPRERLMSIPQLLAIAPNREWWKHMMDVEHIRPTNAQDVACALLERADQLGDVDLKRIVGRGASINDRNEVVWHLGNRLNVDGREIALQDADDGRIYISSPLLDVGDEETKPLSPAERDEVRGVLMRYRWLTEMDCRIMLGWIVTSMMGGALPWRPHLWLVGQADQGKTWFATNVIDRIHQTMAEQLSDPTAASIARMMASDSLPLVLDEAEPDRKWLHEVLELCRIATAGVSMRSRSDGPGKGVQMFHPRFSACMMSTKLPQMQSADNTRFVTVRLSPTGIQDWISLEADIMRLFAPPSDVGRRIRLSVMRDTRRLVDVADERARQYAAEDGTGSRTAKIEGALTAAWEWWGGSGRVRIHHPMLGASKSDGPALLYEMLTQVVPGGRDGPVNLMTELTDIDIYASQGRSFIEQYGLKKHKLGLLVVADHPGMNRLLRNTRFANVLRGPLLLQIKGVYRHENPIMVDGRRPRPVVIPYGVLQALEYTITDTKWQVATTLEEG